MSDLRDLYQEVILDHTKHPRNFGTLEHATHRAQGRNPLCGDQLALFVGAWLRQRQVADFMRDGMRAAEPEHGRAGDAFGTGGNGRRAARAF